MEHMWDWLIVLVKHLHIPFIVSLQIDLNSKKENSEESYLGDNLPYIFLK
jgi:hypothetical protein